MIAADGIPTPKVNYLNQIKKGSAMAACQMPYYKYLLSKAIKYVAKSSKMVSCSRKAELK
jgi:hypothetical protein